MTSEKTKQHFLETGKKLELSGTLITILGTIITATGTLSRIIFTSSPLIYSDYTITSIILGTSLITTGSIINYLTLKWMKREKQKIQNNLKNNKKTQELEKFQKTTREQMEHFGYQLQKGGISFASLAILTLTYAWIAVHNPLKIYTSYNIYTNHDIYISLIIVTASLATAAVLLIYGEYWKNKAQKQN